MRGEHPFNHKGQLLFLILFMVVWFLDSFVFHESTYLSSKVPLLLRVVILILSIAMFVYLFRAAFSAFRKNSEKVITDGPFKYVRHPIYLAVILLYIGLAVSTVSLYSILLIVPIFFFYNYIAAYEEKYLTKKYGKVYGEYKRKANRWFFL
jgi:protein-S-isoprenylcysteine O-methyltransferase Ste14